MQVLLREGDMTTTEAATAAAAGPGTMIVTAVGLVVAAALLGCGVKRAASN